ncbi:roundabout homolog 1 [Lepeophtheirus salmonis]|uniref:roundabout homolog 1 n=1 Tax=Lepeophtheirus salmonis TaxID=72036 RepID=UPI001AE19B4D|nr:hemicentin-1-like [Lepeophtheirus salmonis]
MMLTSSFIPLYLKAFLLLLHFHILVAQEKEIYTVVGASAHLPCNISAPDDDGALLVLWYRNFDAQPIYSFDNRFSTTKHWSEDQSFGPRALFRDNSIYPGILSELIISNVQFEDGGYYKCRVDFRRSQTRSETLHLRIIEEPDIPSIVNQNGTALMGEIGPFALGEALILLCTVDRGNPRPAVSWWRNGELWDDEPDPNTFDEVQQNTLVIAALDRSHHGNEFSCVARNNNVTGSPSSRVKVILRMPVLDIHLSSLPNPVTSDTSYEVLCQATGAQPLPNITWFLDSTLIQVSQVDVRVTHRENLTTSSLYFTPKMKDHGRILTCIAENELGKANATRELSIHFVPIVSLEMMNEKEYVLEGEDLVLECHIKARPRVWRVIWYHNGKEVQPNGDRVVIPEEGTLLLRNVTKERSGDYLCSATNVEGDGFSKIVKISVYYKPVCRDARIAKSIDYINDGRDEVTTISLGCGVDAKPEVKRYRWLVNSSDSESVFEIPSAENSMTFSNYKSTTGAKTRGQVLCWASNEIGEQGAPCIFHVVPIGAPHPPTNCKIRNHTASTIVVSCAPGFNGGLTQHFIMEVYETAQNNSQILIATNWTDSSDRLIVRGLTPESNYILSIKSVNERGESSPVYLGGKTEGYIHYLPVKNEFSRLPLLFVIIGILVSLMAIGLFLTVFLAMKKRQKHERQLARDLNNRRNGVEEEEGGGGGAPLLVPRHLEQVPIQQHQPCIHCSRKELLATTSPVERTVIKTFSVDKKRPICPVCNPQGKTPYPRGGGGGRMESSEFS